MPKITIIRVDEKGVLRYHAGRAYGANCQLIQEQGLQSLMKFLLLYILELNAGEHYKTTTELISSTLIVLQFDYQKSRDAALSWTMNGHHFCGSAYFAWSSWGASNGSHRDVRRYNISEDSLKTSYFARFFRVSWWKCEKLAETTATRIYDMLGRS